MNAHIRSYEPGNVTATVHLYTDGYFDASALRNMRARADAWFQKYRKEPGFYANDLLVYFFSDRPGIRVFFAFQHHEPAYINELIDALCEQCKRMGFGVTSVRVTAFPEL